MSPHNQEFSAKDVQDDRDISQRLFVDAKLGAGAIITLQDDIAHYLIHVLRKKAGDKLRLFNGMDGEWSAEIAAEAKVKSKRAVDVAVRCLLRPQDTSAPITLACAPIKKAHFDYMIEKATELGVAVIQPVLTARTQVREVNIDRLASIMREAAEQSERLTLPIINPPITLSKLVEQHAEHSRMIVCAEWGDALPAADGLRQQNVGQNVGHGDVIITGPEGGFTAEELTLLRTAPHSLFIRLGPRILRADTAAIAALTLWQTFCGDWHQHR